MSKKTSRRVLLKRAEHVLATDVTSSDLARVVLFVDNRLAIGQTSVQPTENGIIEATALATLQALTKTLPEGASLILQKTIKMQPNYLDDSLVVVMVDAKYDDLELNLTGASIVRNDKEVWGAANAILDATNRLTAFLLDIDKEEDDAVPDDE